MKDLSSRVEVTEDCQKEVELSLASLNTSRPARRGASPQVSPDPDHDVVEEVCRHVAQLDEAAVSLLRGHSMSEEEDQPTPRRGKQIKSGMDQTGATTV